MFVFMLARHAQGVWCACNHIPCAPLILSHSLILTLATSSSVPAKIHNECNRQADVAQCELHPNRDRTQRVSDKIYLVWDKVRDKINLVPDKTKLIRD